MIRPVAMGLALALALPAMSLPAAAQDRRLVEVPYDETEVFQVNGRVKVQATIRFAEDEAIENVAIGDSAAWQVTPNKRANLLFVKPLEARAATNMTVVTNKRTYLFDLIASPNARPIYVLSFSYPDEPVPTPAEEQRADARTSDEQMAAADPYAVRDPAALNFAWNGTGDTALLPKRAFDDGESVFLDWPAGRAMPAILMVDHEGVEGPVNYTVRGDMLIVDGVPGQLILRSGDEKAVLVRSGAANTAAENG